jgi:hypothetical protein
LPEIVEEIKRFRDMQHHGREIISPARIMEAGLIRN